MNDDRIARTEQWAWHERTVDAAQDHLELRYGSAEDSDWNAWMPIARVGRPRNKVFPVEFIVDRADATLASAIRAVVEELDYYLVAKRERNPWAYAQYHCGTAANLYSSVHWSFHRRTKRQPRHCPDSEVNRKRGRHED